jgi:hypothetical protein
MNAYRTARRNSRLRLALGCPCRHRTRRCWTMCCRQARLGRQKWCTQRRIPQNVMLNLFQHPSCHIDRRVETRNGPWSRRRVCTNKFRATRTSVYAPQYPNIVIPAKAGTHGLIFTGAIRFWFARRHEDREQLLYAFVPLCEPFCR